MSQHRKNGIFAFGLIAFFSWLTISSGTSTLYSPVNLPLVLVGLLSSSFIAVLFFMPIVFLIWCWPILRGEPVVPRRSIILLALSIALSIFYFVRGIDFGIQYQGRDFVIGVGIVNAIFWILLVVLAVIARRRPHYRNNLIFHFALFAWLAYYAFPYLGESP